MEWPAVGGGGDMNQKPSNNDLFERMCAWEDENYIMAAGSCSGTDRNETDGIVDGHAYTILSCVAKPAGSEFDMVKVRNPWHKGEFKGGEWVDDSPMWDKYPQVKALLNPVQKDDGIFWMEREEFFKYFKTVYLCAKDMKTFMAE